MMKTTRTILAAVAASLLASGSALAGDVRIMWYSDGVEGEVMQDLLDRFMEANPDHAGCAHQAYRIFGPDYRKEPTLFGSAEEL